MILFLLQSQIHLTFASLKSKEGKAGREEGKNFVVTLAVNWCLFWEDSSPKDVIFDLPA